MCVLFLIWIDLRVVLCCIRQCYKTFIAKSIFIGFYNTLVAIRIHQRTETFQIRITVNIFSHPFNKNKLIFCFYNFQLFTDGWFLAGFDETVRERLQHNDAAPTFVYLFAHKGEASFTEIFHGGKENFYGMILFCYLLFCSKNKINIFPGNMKI